MNYFTLLLSTFAVAIPAVFYYVYWAILSTRRHLSLEERGIILEHTRKAYIIIAAVIVYIPGMLLYFLYTNVLMYFPSVLGITVAVLIALTAVFEFVNYLSYSQYGKKRIIEV